MPEIIYFAHSMRDYGTKQAKDARETIQRLIPTAWIYDPEDLNWQGLQLRLGSYEAVYDYVIARSDRVVALEHAEHIGRGVFDEIKRALNRPIPVGVLRRGVIHSVNGIQIVDPDDWKVRYGRIHRTVKKRNA